MQRHPAEPVARRGRRRVALGLAACTTAAAALTAVPGVLGLAGRTPLAQLVAFRAPLALVLLAAAVVVLVCPPLVLRLLRPLRSQRGAAGASGRSHRPRATTTAAAGLALAAAAHLGVLAARGAAPTEDAPRRDGDLVVLSLNTEHGGASADQVAEAVRSSGADVVALPETPAPTARQVAAALTRPFRVLTASTDPSPTHSTSLLLAQDLGAAAPALAPDVALGAVAATPSSLPGPVVAVHGMAPVPGVGQVGRWRQDVPRAVAACTGAPGSVVAGDFNATLDHPGLLDSAPCVDAAAGAGAGALGTWPASVPSLLAAPIDHVLVDARTWRVVSVRVVTVGDSDHRGLVVHLARLP